MSYQVNFLKSSIKQFSYYRLLGDKTIQQLDREQLFWQFNKESNSIAIVIKHLHGNMLSRWSDFLTTDGEKEWRQREEEFEVYDPSFPVIEKWNEGWNCLEKALSTISVENFDQKITIRTQEHSISDAISRQLAHYAYHVGQIVYIGRMLKGQHWKSLSIPKGKSEMFNKKMLAQKDKGGHYTDRI